MYSRGFSPDISGGKAFADNGKSGSSLTLGFSINSALNNYFRKSRKIFGVTGVVDESRSDADRSGVNPSSKPSLFYRARFDDDLAKCHHSATCTVSMVHVIYCV